MSVPFGGSIGISRSGLNAQRANGLVRSLPGRKPRGIIARTVLERQKGLGIEMKPQFLVYNDDGEQVPLPSKLEVCWRCRGEGVHDHEAFENGISQDQFDEDPDFRVDYMRGRYDVQCSECHGLRVVAVPDEERLNADQKRWLEEHRQYRREEAAERAMRARGIQF